MPEATAQPVLRFERVTVAFDGVPAVRDLSFEASAGETRVIMGAAGSGKTVLLKTAMGLQPSDAGTVRVFGQTISGMPEHKLFEIRSRIGMLFQESALFDSLTIEGNVAYPLLNQESMHIPPGEVRPRVEEALRFVELGETLEKFPSELSGGMRRRAAIARAVVTQPPLLLYDSPTAGLDPITAHTIIALIVKERDLNDTTTLIVTHRYQDGNLLANFCYDRATGNLVSAHRDVHTIFMVLKEGNLVFEGNQDELEANRDPYIATFYKHRK